MGKGEPGIRETRSGWQAIVRSKKAGWLSKHFSRKKYPDGPPLELMRQWREEQLAKDAPKAVAGLEADAKTYLDLVSGLTSYQDREYHIYWWVGFLGKATERANVTTVDVRRGLKQLEKDGKAAGTRNHYRTALLHFYRMLNGRGGFNPVRDTDKEPQEVKRWQLPAWNDARKAINALKGQAQPRLTVLLYTGWPSAQLKRLEPGDIDHQKLIAYLGGRKKGKGTSSTRLPILPQASVALKQMKLGEFSGSSLRQALHRGCVKAEVTPFRVYDLRHLFLTTAALAIRDDRVVQALALHHPRDITARYIEQSVDPRVKDGLKALKAYLKKHFKDG